MKNYDIYIISLKNEFFQAKVLEDRLRANGCEVEIIHVDAVDGRILPAKKYFEYISNAFKKKGQLIAPGMLGCALSHLSVLKKIVEKKRSALILEYDAILLEDFHELMNKLSTVEHASVIQMCCSERLISGYLNAKTSAFNAHLGLDKLVTNEGMWYTAAYAVNPSGAQEIISSQLQGPFVMDDWYELVKPDRCDFYFKKIFDHPDEPNPDMEKERVNSNGSVVESVLNNYELEVIERISAKKVLINRLQSKFKILTNVTFGRAVSTKNCSASN